MKSVKPKAERRCIEKGFLQSEERFRLLFEKSSDPTLLLDGDVFIDCNEAALKCMRGSSRDQLIGMRPWDISPERQPDGRLSSQKAAEVIRRALRKGNGRFEWLLHAFDGEELWMDVSLTVIPVKERQIMYTIWRDITERKRAEEALIASRLRLSEALDLAGIVYWELDPETGEFIYNDPFYALYGTTAEREGGYRMSREEYRKRFLHPDDVPLFEQAGERRMANRAPEFHHELEHRIVRRDGEVRYILARVHVKRDARGRISRSYGANQDITERKQTAKALQESEERYRIAIEHSNDGVAIIKGDQYVYVNPRFCAMLGYDDLGEILGRPIFITVHPDDRERVLGINRERQQGRAVPSRYEYRGVRKDGTSIGVEVSAVGIVYQGEPATLAYVRDITERQRDQEQLRQLHKMEAIGTLAGGIAHDFNNMLAIILGNAELALDDLKEKSPARENVKQIFLASRRGRDLVKQILAFSRKDTEDRKPLNMTPLLKETFKMLRASVPSTVSIKLRIRTKSPIILVDPSQMQQVLINLVTNGVHAMGGDGQLSITLSTSLLRSVPLDNPDVLPGRYLQLAVKDTGTGMTPDVQRRVFEPFFTTKEPGQGTGMGLAVVYGIVKSHGGFITVESKMGEGSTFAVFLPCEQAARVEDKESTAAAPSGKGRILLVDDEVPLVAMTRRMLERLGYNVACATHSSEALRLFLDNPSRFDLVIADQVMPEMTGLHLAEQILNVRKEIPIILCTGYSETVSVEQAKRAGIREFLMKPLAKAELAGTIRRVLKGKA